VFLLLLIQATRPAYRNLFSFTLSNQMDAMRVGVGGF